MNQDVLKRAFKKFQADKMSDHAAGMTYFLMMSLFPALLVIISLLGLFGTQGLVVDAVQYARDQGAPPEVVDALRSSLQGTVDGASGAVGVALLLGLAVALYGASGAFGGAGRALNDVYGFEETRPFVKHKLEDLLCTFVVVALVIVALVSVFLGGSVADDLFEEIGLGGAAADVWRLARWLVAIAAMMCVYAFVYTYAPDRGPDRRVQWFSPGAVAGVLIWVLASAGFFFYVANFGSYGATYGTFAGAIILLLWMYLTNIAFLFGAELNAELDRLRIAGRGGPPPPSGPPTAEDPTAEHRFERSPHV